MYIGIIAPTLERKHSPTKQRFELYHHVNTLSAAALTAGEELPASSSVISSSPRLSRSPSPSLSPSICRSCSLSFFLSLALSFSLSLYLSLSLSLPPSSVQYLS